MRGYKDIDFQKVPFRDRKSVEKSEAIKILDALIKCGYRILKKCSLGSGTCSTLFTNGLAISVNPYIPPPRIPVDKEELLLECHEKIEKAMAEYQEGLEVLEKKKLKEYDSWDY